MNVETYVFVAAMVALFFGAMSDIEQGDYPRVVAMLFCALAWPVAAALGVGLGMGKAFRVARRVWQRLTA